MPLLFVRNDITKMKVDAIVNAAKTSLLGGGGVDGCIHRAAGPELLEECRTLGGCNVGDAKKTSAYNLPCKYVIHTVGPVWNGGLSGEVVSLRSCYQRSLEVALDCGCETIAFPLISSGSYGYPKEQAMAVAVEEIKAFLSEHDMTVYLVLFDQQSMNAVPPKFGKVKAFIDNHYVDMAHQYDVSDNRVFRSPAPSVFHSSESPFKSRRDRKEAPVYSEECFAPVLMEPVDSLEKYLDCLDESFSEMLLRTIDEKGMTDAQCYKKANIDRKHFGKIKNNPNYKPGKTTVLAFAVALELSLDETKEMLMKAGFALSHSNKFDIIIEYYLSHGIYDIDEINEALFHFDQVLLGA